MLPRYSVPSTSGSDSWQKRETLMVPYMIDYLVDVSFEIEETDVRA